MVLIAPRGAFCPTLFLFHRVLARWDKFPFSTGAWTVNLITVIISFSFLNSFFYYFNQIDGSGYRETVTQGTVELKVCRHSYGAIEYVYKNLQYIGSC